MIIEEDDEDVYSKQCRYYCQYFNANHANNYIPFFYNVFSVIWLQCSFFH